jgi:plastocyanin
MQELNPVWFWYLTLIINKSETTANDSCFTSKVTDMKARDNYLATMLIAVPLFALLCIFSGCSKSNDYNTNPTGGNGNGNPGTNEIWIQGSEFNPSTKTVAVNTTLTWTNKDSYAHTVTSDSTMFDSGNLAGNGTFSYTFTQKGTFNYHCKIHSMMKGTVIVN